MNIGSRRRLWTEWLLSAGILVLLTVLAAHQQWLLRVDRTVYDLALSTLSRPAPSDIVIVAIDQPSLERIGRWPWPRAVHATLLERITSRSPKAIGLDVIFSEADRAAPGEDRALAEALASSGRTVLPVHMESAGGLLREIRPAPLFAQRAARVAHSHVELDSDGIARSVFLREGLGAPTLAHFAVAMEEVGFGRTRSELPGVRAERSAPADRGAWVRDYWLQVAFAGPPGHFRRVSYVDVLLGGAALDALRDRYVLVGATAAGLRDAYPTPVSGEGRAMPGIEINANVLDALLRGHVIRHVPQAWVTGLSGGLVLLLLLALLRLSPRQAFLGSVLFGIGILAGAWFMLRLSGWWFAPSAAFAGTLICYPMWSWRRLEATQRALEDELRRFADEPDVLPLAMPAVTSTRLAGHAVYERRLAQVREAGERVRSVRRFVTDTLNALPEAALVIDRSAVVVLANREAGRLFGQPAESLAGRRLDQLAGTIELPQGMDWSTLFAGAPNTVEADLAGGGSVLVNVVAFEDAHGGRNGILMSVVDISPLKDAERKREEYMRFLSHDLRSPLVSMLALLDLSELGTQAAPPDLLARMRRSVERALALAEDFVQLGRAESVEPDQFAPIDLTEILSTSVEEIESQARSKSISVTIAKAPEHALSLGVRDVIQRVLINLLSNAVKYSPASTRVTCTIEAAQGVWRTCVADEGQGIAAEDLPKLFDRFERLGAARQRAASGAGLGLAFVKTAIEKHGGTIAVESTPGAGSRFIVSLPARHPSAPD